MPVGPLSMAVSGGLESGAGLGPVGDGDPPGEGDGDGDSGPVGPITLDARAWMADRDCSCLTALAVLAELLHLAENVRTNAHLICA